MTRVTFPIVMAHIHKRRIHVKKNADIINHNYDFNYS